MATTQTAKGKAVDMKLEVVVIGISDVDRAKAFYEKLGWRLDADFAKGGEFHAVQLTPPNSRGFDHLRKRCDVAERWLDEKPDSRGGRHRRRPQRLDCSWRERE